MMLRLSLYGPGDTAARSYDATVFSPLRQKVVRIYSGEHHAYLGPDRCSYYSTTKGAGLYSFEDAHRATKHYGPEKRIEYELAVPHGTTPYVHRPTKSADERALHVAAQALEKIATHRVNHPSADVSQYAADELARVRTLSPGAGE